MNEEEISKEQQEVFKGRFYRLAVGKGIMNLPNKLTLLRIIMIPLFVLFFYLHFSGHYFVAFAVYSLASITDFLDGYIARKYKLVTNFGKFLDPIADKVLVLTAFVIFLTIPTMFTGPGDWAFIVGGCSVALMLSREIIVSGFRMVAASSGMVIAADIIGKWKTLTQDLCIGILLVGEGIKELTSSNFGVVVNYVGLGFLAFSAFLTLLSGINYIIKNREVLKK